jgi:phosphoribosyl 1,2-cyclic phosphate phosphodiesterase
MPVYADALTAGQLKNEFPYIFDGTNYPGIPQVDLQVIDEQPFEVQGVPITPVLVYHFKMPVTSYRIGDFCYITDANRIPEASMERLRGTRILVINALRKETHISHFNLQQALEVAAAINPEVTYLIHMSHHMGRHAEVEPELPPNVFFSYDGLRVKA